MQCNHQIDFESYANEDNYHEFNLKNYSVYAPTLFTQFRNGSN